METQPSQPLFGSLAFANLVEEWGLALIQSSNDGSQRLLVSKDGDTALCPGGGPYLHYAYSGQANHANLFATIPVLLKEKGFKRLSIRFPPAFYFDWIKSGLAAMRKQSGFQEIQDTNYHLPLHQSFKENLPPDQRRVLRLAEDTGYSCSFSQDWRAIHNMVSVSRMSKGFSDPISLELLVKLVNCFPLHYQGIVCQLDGDITGAGVLIRVDERVLYLFYVANHPEHVRHSPSLQLINFCAEWAKNQGFTFLDLGTASKHGVVNEGVKRFKESIGGIESNKSTFQIPL